MPNMNVSLSRELADFVETEVSLGRYPSTNAVLDDALRNLKEERDIDESKLAILRREVGLGLAEAERGEFSTLTIDEIFRQALDESTI